jgi:hypothetical protein
VTRIRAARGSAAACAYLTDEGLISVDWTSHPTPATVSLTHEGIRLMEEPEEEEEAQPDD